MIATSALAFTLLKWVGAAYLIYLGIKLWRSPPPVLDPTPGATRAVTMFWHATLVTALNPKSITFFVAFVPHFIDPAAALAPQFIMLVATFVGLATLNAAAYALLAGQLRVWLGRPGVLLRVQRGGGGALIGMGLATAMLKSRSS